MRITHILIAGTAGAALLCVPLVFAQTTNTSSSSYCPQLSQTLRRGVSDSDTVPQGQVSELQKFLAAYYRVDPATLVVGYFGPLTQRYVVQFQTEKQLPAYGIVGGLTDQAITAACGGAATPATVSPVAITAPTAVSTTLTSNQSGVSATIDTDSLVTSSNTPVLSGSAFATSSVIVVIQNNNGSATYASGVVPVSSTRWSASVVSLPGYAGQSVSPGSYGVVVYDSVGDLLATGRLVVRAPSVGRAAQPSCTVSASPNAVSAGQNSTLSWTTTNASSTHWVATNASRGTVRGTAVIPNGAPSLSGSQTLSFPTSGFSSVTLAVEGPTGHSTCTGYVLVLGSSLPAGFGTTTASANSTTLSATVDTTSATTAANTPMPDPTGILSVSPCISGGAAGAGMCSVTANWITSNTSFGGSPQIRLDISNLTDNPVVVDKDGVVIDKNGVASSNYLLSASASGSKTVILHQGTYIVSLMGYKSDGSVVLLQKQYASVAPQAPSTEPSSVGAGS